jgi:hypothetical protein
MKTADARATMKENRVSKLGVIQAISTTNQLQTTAIGEVTNEDHHSSFGFFVAQIRLNLSMKFHERCHVLFRYGWFSTV